MRRLWLAFFLLGLGACEEDPVFTGPQTLGGVEVSAKVLEKGRHVYRRYCVSCHGAAGDGKGPAAYGQWPAPRDFRQAKFKFTGVQDRGLPSDTELRRVITQGLRGTYMRAWILQEAELEAVVQYIKTFSKEGKGFRSKRLKIKEPEIPADPYVSAAEVEGAVKKGEELYHAMFQCSSCHPAYVKAEQVLAWDAVMRPESPFDSIPKYSENYRSVLLPPDFLRHEVRAIRVRTVKGKVDHNASDLYRTIAYGLQGPMPGYGHLGVENVWAVAHYLKSLLDMKDTDEARALRKSLVD
jgi:mono/diheme cytochrome c family protein